MAVSFRQRKSIEEQRFEIVFHLKAFSAGRTRKSWRIQNDGVELLAFSRQSGQHCAHVVSFATHSYEQDYQQVRRCWRFGQQRPVVVDRVCTEGEAGIAANLARKSAAWKETSTGDGQSIAEPVSAE